MEQRRRAWEALVDRLREATGTALVMSLGTMTALAIMVTTSIELASAGSRSAERMNGSQQAFALAEAGINNAVAVLSANYPDGINPFPGNASLLPLRSTTYTGGTSWWCGSLDTVNAVWTITSYGQSATAAGTATAAKTLCGSSFNASPTAPSHTLSATVPVYPDTTPRAAPPIWSWVYAPCDATLTNSGTMNAPMYVGCSLDIQNSLVVADRLYVGGNLTFSGQGAMDAKTMPSGVSQLSVAGLTKLMNTNGHIGTVSTAIGRADLIGGCVQKNKTGYPNTGNKPCTWGNSSVNIASGGQNNTVMPAPPVTPPVVDWLKAYTNAWPGPRKACTTTTGAPPLFESSGSTVRDNSLDLVAIAPATSPAAQNLTPATSYTCKTNVGELSWNASTRVLTVSGSIYIDGSVVIDMNWATDKTATYNSIGTLWASGTILVKNAALCAVPNTASTCYTAGSSGTGSCATAGAWDPNKCLLILAANGNGSSGGVQGQVAAGDGLEVKSGAFQGGAYATQSVESSTTGRIDGPMISESGTIHIGQSTVSSFPPITFLNAGAPGDTAPQSSGALGTPVNFRTG